MDERELVQRVLDGEEAAKTLFYETHAPRLKPVCIHFLGPHDPDLEDIVQEAFLIGFRKLEAFEFRSSLYTWLAHICVNLCYQRIHKRRKHLASLEEDLETMTIPQIHAQNAEKEEADEKSRKIEFLAQLIRTMGEKCRKILELRDRRGESYVAICKALKVPMGTVMSQLARCRETLKKMAQSSLGGGTLMPDLVREYFERDLSASEWESLEAQLESSLEDSQRFARYAKGFYLGLGLPDPENPGGGAGALTSVVKIVLLLAGLAVLVIVAMKGIQSIPVEPENQPALIAPTATENPGEDEAPTRIPAVPVKPKATFTPSLTASGTATIPPRGVIPAKPTSSPPPLPPLPALPTATPTSRPSLFPQGGYQGVPLNH